jgi:hypothetical protein
VAKYTKTIIERVSDAALIFESRWTYGALRRRSPDIATRLHEQRNLFVEACVTDASDREVIEQGEALLRGYAIAMATLEQAAEPDDSYMLGVDTVSGTKIVIGHSPAAADRVRKLHGKETVWITPDEVARIIAGAASFQAIAAVKRVFPGAQAVDQEERE